MFSEFITQLQKELELKEPLGADGQDAYSLLLDETTKITITDSPPGFQLAAKIGYLPTEKVEEFLSYMLRSNLFGQATHNAVLGLDETGANVTLNFHYKTKPSFRDFFDAFQDFVNTILFWQEEIKSHPSPNLG